MPSDPRQITRRDVGAGVIALLLAPLAACTRPQALPVIGYLEPIAGNSPTNAINLAAFRQGLSEVGFVEGKNVAVEFRYAGGDIDRLPALAAELVNRRVTVILASTPNAARPAKALTKTIPIVFAQAADAIENGEVANLERPESNLTGVANFNELMPKRLELLNAIVPASSVIAYVSDPNLASFERNLRQAQQTAEASKRQLLVLKAANDGEFGAAIAALAERRAGGLLVGPLRGAYSRPTAIVALAARYPIPTMYYDRAFVDVGGLMSFGAEFKRIYYLAGTYVGRILNGAKVADLPVLQPKSFELVLNLRTAKTLGLTFPPMLLTAASELIE